MTDLSLIKEHLEVVGSDGGHVGRVDHVHGDQIELGITIVKLGRSSMVLKTVAMAGDEIRFIADHVLVCINEQGRPRSWPDPVRAKINDIMEGSV